MARLTAKSIIATEEPGNIELAAALELNGFSFEDSMYFMEHIDDDGSFKNSCKLDEEWRKRFEDTDQFGLVKNFLEYAEI